MIVLDTHIFVWLNQNDPRLTNYHRQLIAIEKFLSSAIALKVGLRLKVL